jgi:UDP-glucose 4-epimerase
MKTLITGAGGFLGRELARRLVDEEHDVILLGRTNPEIESAEFLRADITEKESLRKCHEKYPDIDCIIHLAAFVPKTKEEDTPQKMLEVNIAGTMNLLEIFGDSIKNFVYASTAEVYGLPDSDEPIKETATPLPLSYYGASKLAGESFCRVYAQNHNLHISMLRFTVLYGPGDSISRAIPNFIKKGLSGEDLDVYGGEEQRDYLHVSDAVEALYLSTTKQPDDILNVGTGHGITIKETAQSIIDAIPADKNLKLNILPRQKKAADIVLDITKIRKELGFKPKRLFPDLIDEQIKWQKNH